VDVKVAEANAELAIEVLRHWAAISADKQRLRSLLYRGIYQTCQLRLQGVLRHWLAAVQHTQAQRRIVAQALARFGTFACMPWKFLLISARGRHKSQYHNSSYACAMMLSGVIIDITSTIYSNIGPHTAVVRSVQGFSVQDVIKPTEGRYSQHMLRHSLLSQALQTTCGQKSLLGFPVAGSTGKRWGPPSLPGEQLQPG
jgi:hypothetical protein